MRPKKEILGDLTKLILRPEMKQWIHLYKIQAPALMQMERYRLEEKFFLLFQEVFPKGGGDYEVVLSHFLSGSVAEYCYRRHVCRSLKEFPELQPVVELIDSGKMKLSTASRLLSNSKAYAQMRHVSRGQAITRLLQEFIKNDYSGAWKSVISC